MSAIVAGLAFFLNLSSRQRAAAQNLALVHPNLNTNLAISGIGFGGCIINLYHTGISHLEIERAANRIKISIFTAKPGIVIGRGGADVEV